MSRIDVLLKRLTPSGVEHRQLEEVITALRTGLNPRQNFKLNGPGASNQYITVRELGGFRLRPTDKTDRVDDRGLALIQRRSKLQLGDVLFSATGTIGRTALVSEEPRDWNIKEGVYAITPNADHINPRFLVYILRSSPIRRQILASTDGSTVASIPMAALRKIRIPVPPLEVQREIVRVLDNFTELEAEMEAELEARRSQYGYYIHSLLRFDESRARWMTLGDLGRVAMCKRVFKSETTPAGDIPFYKIGTFGGTPDAFISIELYQDYRAKYSFPKKGDVLISAAGTIGRAISYDGEPAYFQDSNIVWLDNDESVVTNEYLRHWYRVVEWATDGGTIQRLYNENIRRARIAVPPLDEQERIVAILDKFDALVNDLSVGLPAELAARRKQYEHYRDRLLTFKELAA